MGGFIVGFTKGMGDAVMQRAQEIHAQQNKEKDAEVQSRWDQFYAWLKQGGHTPEEIDRARNSVIADVQKIYGGSKPLKEIFQRFGQVLESVHKRAAGGAGTGTGAPGGTPAASASPGAGRPPVQAGPSAGLPPPPAKGAGTGAASATQAATAGATAKPTGLNPPPAATAGARPAPATAPATMPAPPASQFAQEAAAANLSPEDQARQDARVANVKTDADIAERQKLALAGGLKPGTPEYNNYVFKTPIASGVPHVVGRRVLGSDIAKSYPGITDSAGNAPKSDQEYDIMLADGQLFASPSGVASAAQPKVLQAGGVPYGVERGGKMIMPGMKEWTQDDQTTLDAALKASAAGDTRMLHRIELAADARARAYASTRMYGAIDKDTGELTFVTPAQVAANPNKYGPASQSVQAMQRGALFDEIAATSDQVNKAIDGLGTDSFTAVQRAKLAGAMASADPRSATDEFLKSEFATALTDAQIQYVTSLVSLQESAMSLRSLGGMGQGSDQLRSAITAMLPGPGTPSKDYAKRQMQLFNIEVTQLKHSLPGLGSTVQRGEGAKTAPSATKPSKKLPPPPKSSSNKSDAVDKYLASIGVH